jgi:hypothetical protein
MVRKKKDIQDSYWLIAIVVAVVLFGSLFALFAHVPDQVFARSEDGVVTLKAVTDSASVVEITSYEGVEIGTDDIASPVYELGADFDAVILDGELTVYVDASWGVFDLSEAVVYVFDRSDLAWKELPTTFTLSEMSISAPVEFVGSVLVGVGARIHSE